MNADSATAGSLLLEVKKLFAPDPAMEVMQDAGGLIRMEEREVPKDILGIRMAKVLFQDPSGRPLYNPNYAIQIILNTPEVSEFLQRSNVVNPYEGPRVISAVPGAKWPADWPHLSGLLENVTVSEALDYILRTFPGIWIYQDCAATTETPRVIYVRFFRLRKVNGVAPFVEE